MTGLHTQAGSQASPADAARWMRDMAEAGGSYALTADGILHLHMPARGLKAGGPFVQLFNDEDLLEAVCVAIERRQRGEVA